MDKISQDTNEIEIEVISLTNNFTILSNGLTEDEQLSWEAKGLMSYLLGRPKDWKVHIWQLANLYKGNKRGNAEKAIRAMINELKEQGYVQYVKYRNDRGHWVHKYKIYPMKIKDFQKKFPHASERNVVERHAVKGDILTSTELPRTELTNNSVCVAAPPVEKIVKKDSKGKDLEISKQDLYTLCVQNRKDWKAEEIEDLWDVIVAYTHPIRELVSFCNGVITTKRQLKGLKKINTEKREWNSKNKKNTKDLKPSKQPLENSKKPDTVPATSERPLANWKERMYGHKKSSNS